MRRLRLFLVAVGGIALLNSPAFGLDDRASTSEGAKLFETIETRLLTAKTLSISFKVGAKLQEPGGPTAQTAKYEGVWSFADGGRTRLEINELTDGRTLFRRTVANGNRSWWHDKGSPPHLVERRPASSNVEPRTFFTRAGVFLPTMPLPPLEATAKERFSLGKFRVGPKERINGADTRRLDFQVVLKGQEGAFESTLWLTPDSSLPVRRMIVQKFRGAEGVAIVEDYPKVVVDRPADPRQFEIPALTKETIVER